MNNNVILLVEDNPDDELLALDALAANQIDTKVVVARNGVEAMNYLFGRESYLGRDAGQLPAVVFLDLKMPKVDGVEVLRRIRGDGRTRLLPVVILTSSNTEEDRREAYTLGANSYLIKPVNFDEFVDAAGQLGNYWLSLNNPPPSG